MFSVATSIFIEPLGRNILLEFVDLGGDGSYRLTSDPGELEKILPRRN